MGDYLKGEIRSIEELTDSQKNSMFCLLNEYFEGYTLENFKRDLKNKDEVILLKKDDSTIRGFSTMQYISTTIDNKVINAIFSGDTIVDKEYWARNELFQTWIPHVIKKKEEFGDVPFYWLLLSSGYRTYKYLPTFFLEYYPKKDSEKDAFPKSIVDVLCSEKFGRDYYPKEGIVRFSHSKERLKDDIAEVSENQKNNSDVSFYLERNPGHANGDELVCLAEINKSNFKRFILKRLSLL